MPDATITATAARRGFHRLCTRAASGERITIAAHGKAVAVLVSLEDAALLRALERFLAGRDLHADDGAEQADWSIAFPDIQPFEL